MTLVSEFITESGWSEALREGSILKALKSTVIAHSDQRVPAGTLVTVMERQDNGLWVRLLRPNGKPAQCLRRLDDGTSIPKAFKLPLIYASDWSHEGYDR